MRPVLFRYAGVVSITVAAVCLPVAAQQEPTLPVVLARLSAYLTDYAKKLPATIATEHYTQRSGTDDHGGERAALVSEFGVLRLDDTGGWLGIRDVVNVNGTPVADSARRLRDILGSRSSRALQQARQIAQENSRFNVGPIERTINDPAVVLELLDSRNRSRMRFRKRGDTTIDGVRVWAIAFEERRRPTVIRSPTGRDQPVSGTAWIEPESGRLLRSEITVNVAGQRVDGAARPAYTATIDVMFSPEPTLDFWVPSRMTERYDGAGESYASGEATYDNYRRFSVETRILAP